MTAEIARPPSVASGMLRFGFSITPAETAALSTPMKAQSAIDAARPTAWTLEPPLTFQAERNVARSNQNQPNNAIPRIGINARLMVQVSRAPTTRGPRMLAKVRSQITAAAANTLAAGLVSCGMSSAKYPTVATATAMFPIQLPNQ